MLIRAAVLADVPAVLPMVERLAAVHQAWDVSRFDYKPGVGEMYRRWLTGRAVDERAVFLVADREDGTLAGFLIATIDANIPVFTPAAYGWVHDLWVEESYRNEGVGRQLVMETLERFRTLGVTQIRLETAAPNEPARALFAKCGFRTSGVEMLREFTDEQPSAHPA